MSMVHCRGCGKEIHSEAQTCPSCGAPQNISASASSANGIPYNSYDEVPWYRKNWFAILTFLIFTPALLFIAVSGDIYYKRNGEVRKYSTAARVFLVLISALWLLGIFFR